MHGSGKRRKLGRTRGEMLERVVEVCGAEGVGVVVRGRSCYNLLRLVEQVGAGVLSGLGWVEESVVLLVCKVAGITLPMLSALQDDDLADLLATEQIVLQYLRWHVDADCIEMHLSHPSLVPAALAAYHTPHAVTHPPSTLASALTNIPTQPTQQSELVKRVNDLFSQVLSAA